MAIFPHIETDLIVQVNDRFRISAEKSFISPDETAVTDVLITPEIGESAISVFDSNSKNWFLDWEYSTDGIKVVTLEVVNAGGSQSRTFSITALTEEQDKLFSSDQNLVEEESDILRYVPKGRNTFKFQHRAAQTRMLEDLYRIGITDIQGNKLTKDAVLDIDEVREWSKFLTLQLIFADLSTTPSDQFAIERDRYKMEALEGRHKSVLKLDKNGDGEISGSEVEDITTRYLSRR